MILNTQEYRDKVLGCWLGKNIGGTLGAPMEWWRQINEVSFYTQRLSGEPLPNDDLDIQLLWLVALEEMGPAVDAHTLADYFLTYVTPHWAEYGTAKANLRAGLAPPLSGTFGNVYKDSCGAFIRSEIWACIAPGSPRLAARYAYEDAIIDHGSGEGTYAEVFTAAMESAAFVENDLEKLIEIGLTYVPSGCGVAGAANLAIECRKNGKTWREARDLMLEQYRGSAFFGDPARVSPEDRKKGFVKGQRGWDAPSNIGMLLIGLLFGEGDFGNTLCTAVNCGEDTDCTAATAGSLFGIIHGAGGIPEKWIAPIGRTIKTACLNLGELGYFGNQLPADVDALTERTLRAARQVAGFHHLPIEIADSPTDLLVGIENLKSGSALDRLYRYADSPRFLFDFFEVAVDYGPDGPLVTPGVSKTIAFHVHNRYKYQTMLNIHLYAPEGVAVEPSAEGAALSIPPHLGSGDASAVFHLRAETLKSPVIRCAVEITQPGRESVMHVPVVLIAGGVGEAKSGE